MNIKIPNIILAIILLLSVFFAGCAGVGATGNDTGGKAGAMAVMSATHTPKPISVDGKLDDPVWMNAPVYALHLADDQARDGKEVTERGEARLAWDDDYLYLGITFHDSDIAAEGKEDQLKHYQLGDLCELFLTPENETWYWELYATPAGRKSSYFIPGRGSLGLPSMAEYTCGLKVAASCNGTLNNWRDKDTSWTAEMAMPVKDLTARGESFGPGSRWRILVSRYNFGRYLKRKGPELSMTPKLSREDFHLLPEYAILRLEKKD